MMQSYQLELINKQQLTHDIVKLCFKDRNGKRFEFIPGQYMIMTIPLQPQGEIKRLYSMASAPIDKTTIEFIVQIIPGGAGSTYLGSFNIGDNVIAQGPAGLFKVQNTRKPKVFMATGTGIAPVRSIIQSLQNPQSSYYDPQIPTYVFWGVPKLEDVYLRNELKVLSATNNNFIYRICVSRETDLSSVYGSDKQSFSLGRINVACGDFFQKQADKHAFEYYLCSGKEIVESMKQYLIQQGVKEENIFSEKIF